MYNNLITMHILHFLITYVFVMQVMFRRVLGNTLAFVGYTVQYGCMAHCAFEYIGEFVVVRIINILDLIMIFFAYYICVQETIVIFIYLNFLYFP